MIHFHFGRRTIDTMGIEFLLDLAKEDTNNNYSLNGLCKKYGVKNTNSHSAFSDTLATKDIFKAQIELLSKALK